MKLDWTDDNLSFSCICLLSLIGTYVEHPLGKREVVGSNPNRGPSVGELKSLCGGNGSAAS